MNSFISANLAPFLRKNPKWDGLAPAPPHAASTRAISMVSAQTVRVFRIMINLP